MGDDHLDRLREIVLARPDVAERTGASGPEFAVGDAPVCSFHDDRSDGGRVALWCASPPGVPDEMVGAEPIRFFHPDPSGVGVGWLGVFLDGVGDDAVDWDEVGAMVDDAVLAVTGGAGHDPLGAASGTFRFTARLWLHTGEAAWCFATVPPAVAAVIDEVHEDGRRGFGSRRVRVTIGTTEWSTSIFPDASTNSYVLPVKKAVRTAERIGEGDVVDVMIELVDVPERDR